MLFELNEPGNQQFKIFIFVEKNKQKAIMTTTMPKRTTRKRGSTTGNRNSSKERTRTTGGGKRRTQTDPTTKSGNKRQKDFDQVNNSAVRSTAEDTVKAGNVNNHNSSHDYSSINEQLQDFRTKGANFFNGKPTQNEDIDDDGLSQVAKKTRRTIEEDSDSEEDDIAVLYSRPTQKDDMHKKGFDHIAKKAERPMEEDYNSDGDETAELYDRIVQEGSGKKIEGAIEDNDPPGDYKEPEHLEEEEDQPAMPAPAERPNDQPLPVGMVNIVMAPSKANSNAAAGSVSEMTMPTTVTAYTAQNDRSNIICCVNDRVFPKLKHIPAASYRKITSLKGQLATTVMEGLGIMKEHRAYWWATNVRVVSQVIDQRRNNVNGELKKVFLSKLDMVLEWINNEGRGSHKCILHHILCRSGNL